VPIVASSTFHGGAVNPYARDQGTATWTAFEELLGALEGGHALAFGSGMAAVAAVFETLPVGSKVVAPAVGYMGARAVLTQTPGRFEPVFVDVTDTAATEAALVGAALLWVESPTNPLLDLADLSALARACRAAGALLAVDNTLATPLRQRPLELGADVVVHSVTKFLGGHSDLLLGAAVTSDEARRDALREQRRLRGALPGALETFLATRGVRTLAVRLDRAEASAASLADRLATHPRVARVRYPGRDATPERLAQQAGSGGALLAFELHGTPDQAEAVCEAVELATHATSLGGVETTLERRARYAGESAAVPASLIRVSVGLEDVDDLWRDLQQALDASGQDEPDGSKPDP
jgi:cystathionine gamma-synthase